LKDAATFGSPALVLEYSLFGSGHVGTTFTQLERKRVDANFGLPQK
jgi:hypothetical protein